MREIQMDLRNDFEIDENGNVKNPRRVLNKLHTYVFYEAEVIATMVTDLTTVMQHVFQPALADLHQMIPSDVLDVTDVIRTLNPYWALWRFTEEGLEQDELLPKLTKRMDELRAAGEDRMVLYIESVYVREDYRRNGMFRMYIDYLKLLFEGAVIWLNMEPTSGAELEREYNYIPAYTVSELGQINMNASIAEKMGFTVDPDTWRRQAEKLDPDGNVEIETVRIRKCAYYLPKEIQKIVKNDKGLVELGRAKQRVMQTSVAEEEGDESGDMTIDLYNGEEGDYVILMMKESIVNGPGAGNTVFCYAARHKKEDKFLFGVSRKSVLDHGLEHEGQLERYEYLDDAVESEYFEDMNLLNGMLADWTAQQNEERKKTMKNEIREISRRAMCTLEAGYDRGPGFILGIDAEIEIEEGGKSVYLCGQWIDEAASIILFEAAEQSVYSIGERINRGEGDFKENAAELERIIRLEEQQVYIDECDYNNKGLRYPNQYLQIREMILNKLKEHDLWEHVEDYFMEG